MDTNICLVTVEQKYGTTEDGKTRQRMLLTARSTPSDMPTSGKEIYDPGSRTMLGDVAIAHGSILICLEEQMTWMYDEPTKSWYEYTSYGS